MRHLLHCRSIYGTFHSPAHRWGWPNKRQALNLARPTVPAVKVSPELPSNRENLAENQQSKQQRGGCVGEQSWCWHLNTGCSCFLMDTPVISTFFLIVSRKCRFFVHPSLHACASFASTDRTASTGSKCTGISHFDKYFQTARGHPHVHALRQQFKG